MIELLNVYKVFFKKGEPIVLAASSFSDACDRVNKLPNWDPLNDPISKIEYLNLKFTFYYA